MVVIRINDENPERRERTHTAIRLQAETGIIVLPPWCEVLAAGKDGEEIRVIQQAQTDRVAVLETQLAAAMADLSKVRHCESCKHEPIDPVDCFETGYACKQCKETGCVCRDCDDGSKWEWRGSHGEE